MQNQPDPTEETLMFHELDLPVTFVVALEADSDGTFTVRSLLDGELLGTGLTPERRAHRTGRPATRGLAYRLDGAVHLIEAQESNHG